MVVFLGRVMGVGGLRGQGKKVLGEEGTRSRLSICFSPPDSCGGTENPQKDEVQRAPPEQQLKVV